MNLINEHNAQLRRMMDLANTIGSNLLLISTESFYHDAISLVFKESFQDTDKLLDWWLYESYDQELYLGEQKFDASDPGNFYDFLVKAGQFLIQTDAAVAFGFWAAFFFEWAALTAFALIDFLRASVFVAPDRPGRFVKEFLPIRANGIPVGVLFEVR